MQKKLNVFQMESLKLLIKKKEKDLYFYEFEYFKKIFENKDYNAFEKRLFESKDVLEMFEKLKKTGKIRDCYNMIEPSSK